MNQESIMQTDIWIAAAGLALTIVSTSTIGVAFLSRQQAKRAVNDALLAEAVNNLASEVSKVTEAIEHLDVRVDGHETRISVLESK